mgnify:CR=1 FL=1
MNKPSHNNSIKEEERFIVSLRQIADIVYYCVGMTIAGSAQRDKDWINNVETAIEGVNGTRFVTLEKIKLDKYHPNTAIGVSTKASNPTADVTLYRSYLFKTIEGLKEKPFGTEFISVVKDTNFEVEKKNGEIYQAGFNSALDQILNIIKE